MSFPPLSAILRCRNACLSGTCGMTTSAVHLRRQFLSKCQNVLVTRFLHSCVPSRRDNRQRSNSTSSGCGKVASNRFFFECQCYSLRATYWIKESFPFVVLIRQLQRRSTGLFILSCAVIFAFLQFISILTTWSAKIRRNL